MGVFLGKAVVVFSSIAGALEGSEKLSIPSGGARMMVPLESIEAPIDWETSAVTLIVKVTK